MARAKRTIQEVQEWAEKETDNRRIRKLAALRIYHQKKVREIDKELEGLIKVEVGLIGY